MKGSGFVSSVNHFVRNILEGISNSYGSDTIDLDWSSDSDSGDYPTKQRHKYSIGDLKRKSHTPHSSNILIKERDYGDYFEDFENPIKVHIVKNMVEGALNVFSNNILHKQHNKTPKPLSNMTKFVENAKNWSPEANSVLHNDNFKDVTPIEQKIHKYSVPKFFKADEDLTEDDLKELNYNIKLLSLFNPYYS